MLLEYSWFVMWQFLLQYIWVIYSLFHASLPSRLLQGDEESSLCCAAGFVICWFYTWDFARADLKRANPTLPLKRPLANFHELSFSRSVSLFLCHGSVQLCYILDLHESYFLYWNISLLAQVPVHFFDSPFLGFFRVTSNNFLPGHNHLTLLNSLRKYIYIFCTCLH